jgi:hypothetical protein
MSASENCPKCGANFSRSSWEAAQQLSRDRSDDKVSDANGPGGFERAIWIVTIISSIIALVELSFTTIAAQSAPQQAAGAALAVAWAAVPYCLARAVQQWRRK